MPRFRFSRVVRLTTIIIGTLLSLLTLTAQHPGAAYFTLNCQPASIQFLHNNVPVLQPTRAQITAPLIVARQTGQNQPILGGNAVSVWALSSDELQIHFDSDPDGTKWIVNSGVCGAIVQPATTNNQAIAIAIASGDGEATAFAQVNNGQPAAFAQSAGQASAFAYAQTIMGSGNTPTAADCIYVVQPGDTLFGIAQRYHVSAQTLGELNNLSNLSLLLVGQQLRVLCANGALPANQQPSPAQPTPEPVNFASNACSPETTHIVAQGDNLFRLALRYGTTVESIKAANNITDPTQIHVGTTLEIPCVG